MAGEFGASEPLRAAADSTGRRVAATSASAECPLPVFTSSDGHAYEPVESFPAIGQTYVTVILPRAERWP